MALNYSAALRNAQLDQVEVVIGATAILRIYSGAKPTATSDAATGVLLAEMTLPADWMAAAAAGSKAKAGTWTDASANAAGTAGYFRIYDSAGTVCGLQGTVTATGGGGDLTLDNVVMAVGQNVTISTFVISAGNA